MEPSGTTNSHEWRFFRAGGSDQVRLERGSDLLALGDLDQKLWVALSCPTRGLEFDEKTLDLLDSDHDGHIRAAEIIAAAKWAGNLLRDPDLLANGTDSLPLAKICDTAEEGRRLIAAARRILAALGRPEADSISCTDTADIGRIFSATPFNGDGIIPLGAAPDAATRAALQDIMDCLGADADRSGEPGVSQPRAEQFFSELRACATWLDLAENDPAILPLGEETQAAAQALDAVEARIDDYFARCRLAAYQPRATGALNPAEADYLPLAAKDLSSRDERILAFPLALAEAGKPLPLNEGLNPAWLQEMELLRTRLIEPLLGNKRSLGEDDWAALTARFSRYRSWLAAKPATSVEKLGAPRIRALLQGQEQNIEALIARDRSLEAEMNAITDVDRLARYCRDLHLLINNFVSFRDFYTRRTKAVFQVGTLYLDGRSCELCVRVEDPNRHATIATLSRLYLAYCECMRGAEKMTIAAAITAGDSDQLMVGRNAVFYDRKGRDWDATIVKLVEHPIGIRQAFWAPYRKIARMAGEQLQKIAASRARAVEEKIATSLVAGAQKSEAVKPAAQAFDVAKFAGIFAAIGLAVGAIGTAIASVVTGLLGLRWWQLPFALAGMLLIVSGPSMAIAWFKLHQRNLGPILDANGWAMNGRARINIPFGTALTATARLPEGAARALVDPYAEKKMPWKFHLFVVVLIAATVLLWYTGILGKWLGGAAQ